MWTMVKSCSVYEYACPVLEADYVLVVDDATQSYRGDPN